MYKKNRLIFFIFIVLLILLSSCASSGYSPDSAAHADGIAFEYYSNYNNEIEIHLPSDINNSIACEYNQGIEKTNKALWIINYDFNNHYLTSYDNPELFKIVSSIKDYLKAKIAFEFELYENNQIIQVESLLSNPKMEEIGYVLITLYLPILIIDNNYSYTVSVPLKSFALIKTSTHIKSINDSNILWEDFISNPNLILK